MTPNSFFLLLWRLMVRMLGLGHQGVIVESVPKRTLGIAYLHGAKSKKAAWFRTISFAP